MLLLAASPDAVGAWAPVGVTDSRLRVFVERSSVRVSGDRRTARVRIGSPGAIAGPIVLVYQDEEVDCRARTWRLAAYDARDADDRIVRQGKSAAAALPVVEGTIGEAVLSTVCTMAAGS
ncbi:surface-adhesin E family protein [uncultured Sphingomonas sp.]|uniref:surface-adhesin E family protein n=1 Tax=uncultured Sphingomonas sp. TaxID=158754 RepID=UPI0035CC0490